MKKNYLFWVAFTVTSICFGQTIFINEIHYDNTGGDVGEGVEICGPAGIDLAGYQVRLYNGSNGGLYDTILNLSGIIPNQQNNMGTLWFPKEEIQNGNPDGFALVDNSGNVIQFLSYGGIITAIDGPAAGMISENIGVVETEATTPVGYSLQLIGSGSEYTDFTWSVPIVATPGLPNTTQTLPVVKNEIEGFTLYPNPVSNGKLFITSRNKSIFKIEIYSMFGTSVYKSENNYYETVNISNVPAGIYMIRVEEDNKIATRKLIIE